MGNNALAAAKEARAKIYAAAAKRATRLAIREHKLRLAAEKRTKNFIKRQQVANKKYRKEEKLKFHYLRLAGQADRKAAREWARHNRHIKEMKYAIKKMIASVAHRKRVVKKSMTFVTKQNALMQKANKAAAKHRSAKFVAYTKAGEYKKQRDHHNKDTKKFTKAATKAFKEMKAAKAKHAKYEKLRILTVKHAKKYHVTAEKEQSRRVFLDKVSRAAKIAAASFRGKVVVQKKFTATAWKQYKAANKIAKKAKNLRNLAIKAWKLAMRKYKAFHAKMIVHKRTSSSLRLKIKSTHFKFKTEQSKLNRIHSAWKKATDKKHKGVLAV